MGGGVLFDVGLLGRCKSMPRTLQKHAQDIAKHAEVGRGRCQACLGRCKVQGSSVPPSFISGSLAVHYSKWGGFCSMWDSQDLAKSMPRTLPSMPRSCQANLHILGSHTCKVTTSTKWSLLCVCTHIGAPHYSVITNYSHTLTRGLVISNAIKLLLILMINQSFPLKWNIF